MAKETLTQDIATKEQLMDFSAIMEPVLSLLEKHWNISVSPKGYKEFTKDYEEGDGMAEPQHDLHDDFQSLGGILNTSACQPGFPGLIDMPSVAYNDKEQGRSPFQSLASALFNYGQAIGTAQEQRFNDGSSKVELRERNMELMEDKSAMRATIAELEEKLAAVESKFKC